MHADIHEILITDTKTQRVYCMSGGEVSYSTTGFGHFECLAEQGRYTTGRTQLLALSNEVKS